MASFWSLPTELLRLVVSSLSGRDQRHALAALAATCRRNHWLFNGILYQADIDPGPSRAMLWAAATGNITTLELAVAHGADVNSVYNLEHFWDPSEQLNFAFDLLHLDSGRGPSQMRVPARSRGTALHFASMMGRDEAVEWLLDHGARLDSGARDLCDCHLRPGESEGRQSWRSLTGALPDWYPLHLALCYGRASTFRTLVGRGASLDKIGRDDSRDDRGGHAFVDPYPTSLHQAVYVGNREIFDIILDFPTSTPESRARIAATVTGLTTLEIAYLGSGLGRREDRAYITRKLVQHAARLPEDREVLVRACKNGAFRTVLDFLESGACRLPSIENLPALLYQSLRPPPPRHQFTQGLDWVDRHFLARPEIRLRDRLDLLRVLLESGVDVSTLHYYIGKGLSPLMLAAHPGHPADTALELIKLILAHGGRPGWTNSGGMTVLHYVAKVLTTPAPGQRLPAVRPFYPPPVEVIRYLLQQGGLHVDAEDNTGRTALDYVYAGIQPYVENRTRRNKLSHMWVRQGVEIAECILEHSKDRMSQEIVAREMARLNHARQELQQAEARAERASKEVRHS